MPPVVCILRALHGPSWALYPRDPGRPVPSRATGWGTDISCREPPILTRFCRHRGPQSSHHSLSINNLLSSSPQIRSVPASCHPLPSPVGDELRESSVSYWVQSPREEEYQNGVEVYSYRQPRCGLPGRHLPPSQAVDKPWVWSRQPFSGVGHWVATPIAGQWPLKHQSFFGLDVSW